MPSWRYLVGPHTCMLTACLWYLQEAGQHPGRLPAVLSISSGDGLAKSVNIWQSSLFYCRNICNSVCEPVVNVTRSGHATGYFRMIKSPEILPPSFTHVVVPSHMLRMLVVRSLALCSRSVVCWELLVHRADASPEVVMFFTLSTSMKSKCLASTSCSAVLRDLSEGNKIVQQRCTT